MNAKFKRIAIATACGAVFTGTVVFACDSKIPADSTDPCVSGKQACSQNTPQWNSTTEKWYCDSAYTVNDFHKTCKDDDPNANPQHNCNGHTDQCWQSVACDVELDGHGNPTGCKTGAASGGWNYETQKHADACPQG